MAGQVDARGGVLVAAEYNGDTITKHANLKSIGTVSIDLPNITTGATGTATATITGAKVGDLVFVQPPDTLLDGLALAGAAITAPDTLTVAVVNTTAGSLNDTPRDWAFLLFEK